MADELPLTMAVCEGRPALARLRVRGDRGLVEVEAGVLPLLGPAGYHGAMVFFWVAREESTGRADARQLWGVRGSVPVPGHAAERFGGNTSCVQVTAGDGSPLVLDAGTGIKDLGTDGRRRRRLHLLLTHLHLDHIQGLMFFAPFFGSDVEITTWGPPAAGRGLRKRLARYISNPLSPTEIGELPARVTFRDFPSEPWRIGEVEIRASLVAHRGPTLGYRLSEKRTSLCYLPDHEPALGQDLASSRAAWISGQALPAAPRC